MKTYNLKTGVEYEFDINTTPEWACAYGYCTEHKLTSALFSAARDLHLKDFFKTLPFTVGKQSVACGDWAARVELT